MSWKGNLVHKYNPEKQKIQFRSGKLRWFKVTNVRKKKIEHAKHEIHFNIEINMRHTFDAIHFASNRLTTSGTYDNSHHTLSWYFSWLNGKRGTYTQHKYYKEWKGCVYICHRVDPSKWYEDIDCIEVYD